jgi:tetratricopeptide (TPR) repeat protein
VNFTEARNVLRQTQADMALATAAIVRNTPPAGQPSIPPKNIQTDVTGTLTFNLADGGTAEAEARWSLGEQAAAEERYEALIARLPNFAWGYIGLADCYWLGPEPTPEPKQFTRAVSIYQRALDVAQLEERDTVCERLAELYEEQGDAEQAEQWRQQAEVEAEGDTWLEPAWPESTVAPSVMAGASHKLGRNAPCWCGSGVKYKRCHLDADRSPLRSS